jgi:signal transduction histidine kinase
MLMVALINNMSITSNTASGPICGPKCYPKSMLHSAVSHPVTDFFSKLFNTDDFPARWNCGNWTDFHGWLYIIADLGIWAAYFAIPVLLIRILVKRKDVPFNRMIFLFLAFVTLCGLTHLMDALIFWWPAYRLSALLRLATAIVSILAAYALSRVFPALLGLRSVRELKLEIAKRKKTEERLSKSEFLLLEAGRIARVGGWEYDLLTKKRNWSKTIYDILDKPYDHDIYQEDPLSYYPAPFRQLLDEATAKAVQHGTKWDIETLAITPNNRKLWVRHMGEAVFNQQGQIIKLRGTLTDIDQYKKHELELSTALKASQEKTERLERFSYVLSHNIRNHTSNLTSLIDMAEVENLDDDNKELILKSRQVTRALTTTLDDLADVIKAQDDTIAKEVINFTSSASKAIDMQSLQVSQAKAKIKQTFNVQEVSFPSLYIDSIMKHLLSNAIRYRDPAKSLQIELRSYKNEQGDTVLECQDNGLGMDMDAYGHKLFNLYATFHPALSGRGVGLFLIKTQIESLKGEILVSSQLGEGTQFRITFKKENY